MVVSIRLLNIYNLTKYVNVLTSLNKYVLNRYVCIPHFNTHTQTYNVPPLNPPPQPRVPHIDRFK